MAPQRERVRRRSHAWVVGLMLDTVVGRAHGEVGRSRCARSERLCDVARPGQGFSAPV